MARKKKVQAKTDTTSEPEVKTKSTKAPVKRPGAKVGDQEDAENYIKSYQIPAAHDLVFVTGNGYVFYGSSKGAAMKYSKDKKVDLFTVKMK